MLHLNFSGRFASSDVFDALSPLFEQNNLRSLHLYGDNYGDGIVVDTEMVYSLADALEKCRTLEHFSLVCDAFGHEQPSVAADAWIDLSSCISDLNSSLESVRLEYCAQSQAGGFDAMAEALGNCTNLDELFLTDSLYPSDAARKAFFNRLKDFRSLKECTIDDSNIDDGDIGLMMESLGSISSLRDLRLSSNTRVTSTGWEQFVRILQQSNCRLQYLELACNGTTLDWDMMELTNDIDDDVLIAIAQSLVNNTTLEGLAVGPNNPLIIRRGWTALANVLCNKSSIDTIYNSNHTLKRVNENGGSVDHMKTLGDITGDEGHDEVDKRRIEGRELLHFLKLNENENKSEVARQKIIRYHFVNGEKNMQTFQGIDLALLPHATAWVGRNVSGLSLLHQLTQSLPSLFGLSCMAKVAAGGKRKRELVTDVQSGQLS